MKKIILILMLFLWSNSGVAQNLDHLPCAKQVYSTLENWETPQKWIKVLSTNPNNHFLNSPTTEIGVWLHLKVYGKTHTELFRLTEHTSTRILFQEKGKCKPKLSVHKKTYDEKKLKGTFRDTQLKKLLAKSKKENSSGVLYLWSPHMNYSVLGAKEIKKIAKELNLHLTYILDPNASLKIASLVAKKSKFKNSALRQLQSFELLNHQMHQHFPSMMLYSKGKLLYQVTYGYDDPKFVKKEILEALKR